MTPGVLTVIGVGGMGEAIARRCGMGRKVLLADYDVPLLDALTERLRGDGYDVEGRRVDVGSADSVAELARTAASLGAVTGIAHTAGLSPAQAPVDAILRVDLLGVALTLDAFERVVAPGGAGVVIASMAGTLARGALTTDTEQALANTPADELLALPILRGEALPDAGFAYSLAKRANQLRVQSASTRWGLRGARVNTISPGVISTPMGQQELAGPGGAGIRAMVEASGTGRLGTAGDIAATAAFLLGPDATFVTGTDLLVDGGVVAAMSAGLPGTSGLSPRPPS
ncbi:SDR family oxidoreductase [Streptomyces sp. NPDC056716]|uniref:SDR family oxidoreductase n=1 Tax=unclassified Streptomyces TaxID=2593676 RepID=UPI00367C3EC3